MVCVSEFDNHCTFLVYRSHHHYVASSSGSITASIANAARLSEKLGGNKNSSSSFFPHQPNLADLQHRLEHSRDDVKLQALKEVVLWAIQHTGSGHEVTGVIGGCSATPASANVAARLLVIIIRYVLPSTNHDVKKLLQLYWEVVDKTSHDGTLREEMLLVCNKLRQDLLHPNEYIRGSTLRLLCKMRYKKIVEPLLESISENLNHSHPYVRRNAVMCIFSLLRNFGSDLLPHASEDIYRVLQVETDISTKRNAFLMLIHCDLDRAVDYVLSVQDKLSYFGDLFQLALLELLHHAVRKHPSHMTTLLRLVVPLVDSCSSPAVAYEGAATLLLLTSSPPAIKAATRAYIGLLSRQADNNVKLSVLDRLSDILQRYRSTLEEFVIDIMRSVASPSLAVRKKALAIGLQLVNSRTVFDVVSLLKKELVKTLSIEHQQTDVASITAYQQCLLQAMRTASRGYLDVVEPILNLLLEFLTDRNLVTASEVVLFVRELIMLYPKLKPGLLTKITDALPEVAHSSVARVCVWMLGEFSLDEKQRRRSLNAIYQALQPLPFPKDAVTVFKADKLGLNTAYSSGTAAAELSGDRAPQPEHKMKLTTRTVVLPDGTYGTENVYEIVDDESASAQKDASHPEQKKPSSKLLTHILSGDFLLASAVAVTVTKLVVAPIEMSDENLNFQINQEDHAKSLLIVGSLLKLCSTQPCCFMSSGASVRIAQTLRLLTALGQGIGTNNLHELWFPNTRSALHEVLQLEKEAVLRETADANVPNRLAPTFLQVNTLTLPALGFARSFFTFLWLQEETPDAPDTLIQFRQLGGDAASVAFSSVEHRLQDPVTDLNVALGKSAQKENTSLFQQRLVKVQQMTGLGDPIYVEAFLQVNQFDFIVELLVINRTQETLQNVNVELSTHGDLKIVDRPHIVNLSPGQLQTLYASIRVQSTETGIIFGHIIFDKSNNVDKEYLVLNELHVDLLDFIQQSWIGELSFRSMWAEFEWENKITISTSMTDVAEFIQHIMRQTNMTIVGQYVSVSTSTGQRVPVEATQSEVDASKEDTFVLTHPQDVWSSSTSTSAPSDHQSCGNCSDGDHVNRVDSLPGLRRLMNHSSFFAVNLYSKSLFGEDALANVSIEKLPNGKLAGTIRIRSRTQGLALSLGDRITIVQRGISQ